MNEDSEMMGIEKSSNLKKTQNGAGLNLMRTENKLFMFIIYSIRKGR